MEKNPTFFVSSRGGKKLAFEGFTYNKDKKDERTGKLYWRCENRSCKGRMITGNGERILKETAHDVHGPDVPAMEVARSLARVREAALSTRDAPAEIVNVELNSKLPEEYRGYWANEPTVKRTIQRIRRKHLPEIPKSLDEVNIPEQWQKNSKGEQWMLCDLSDDAGNGRLIIFCTERNLQYLSFSHVWYGDGTFSVCPTFFYQLYTIHGVVMGQLLPLAYCLLTRKTRQIYTQLFLAIRDQAEKRGLSLAVTTLRVDFEKACIRAFADVFPESVIECCFFHLSQAHWRKIVDLGLRGQYVSDEHLALSLRMFTALAFVPCEHVYHVFAQLCEHVPDTAHLFIPYMEETYIGRYKFSSSTKPDGSLILKRQWSQPQFPISIWNVNERTRTGEPRTNNQLEGWHRRFKAIVDKHHPNIYSFLDKLRGEQSRTETVIEKLISGQKPTESRQKTKRANEQIQRIVREFDERPVLDFLKGISYNIKY